MRPSTGSSCRSRPHPRAAADEIRRLTYLPVTRGPTSTSRCRPAGCGCRSRDSREDLASPGRRILTRTTAGDKPSGQGAVTVDERVGRFEVGDVAPARVCGPLPPRSPRISGLTSPSRPGVSSRPGRAMHRARPGPRQRDARHRARLELFDHARRLVASSRRAINVLRVRASRRTSRCPVSDHRFAREAFECVGTGCDVRVRRARTTRRGSCASFLRPRVRGCGSGRGSSPCGWGRGLRSGRAGRARRGPCREGRSR